MSRLREWALIAAVAIAAAAAGYTYNLWRTAPAAANREAVAIMMGAHFPDLTGERQALGQWAGKVLVVNFWATWCAPCREEIPVFVRMQAEHGRHGLQFVGIAIDQADKVRDFAAEFGMNFPVLIGGADAIELARALGNRAGVLPFTVIIGRDGALVSVKVGAIKEAQLAPVIGPLL
jgi:thiol-disulfide isomerase/thioredoxin